VVVPNPEVVMAASEAEAVAAFGDGSGVTVIGGGTVMTPLLTHGALWPETVLMLQRAGLGGIVDSIVDSLVGGGTLEIGAAATLAAVADVAPEPLASAARIPDYEIRGQATLGGNIMIGGDLQTALVAMGAHVRSAGAFVQQRRRHSHTHPVLTVAVARRADGGVHVAVGSLAPRAPAVACPSVEQALAGGAGPREAAAKVVDDVSPEDDPLASAWYRRRVLPVLVARALEQLEPAPKVGT
jgi:CO/xanthine dehydrogenase FAD-binding subunit